MYGVEGGACERCAYTGGGRRAVSQSFCDLRGPRRCLTALALRELLDEIKLRTSHSRREYYEGLLQGQA